MSQTLQNQNINFDLLQVLKYLPSNRGYTSHDKNYYGSDAPINTGKDIKLITPEKTIQIWLRKGFVEMEQNTGETDWDALMLTSQRRLIASRVMKHCPTELENSGLCLERLNPEHKKFFYHFAAYTKDGHMLQNDDCRVKCKFDHYGSNKCWERYNGKHTRVFFHNDDPHMK
mgnify:CR=1 FL=1